MSDALTDLVRDGQRGSNYNNFLELLIGYLGSEKKTESALEEIKRAAVEFDEVHGGWTAKTNLSKGLSEGIAALEKGDKTEWARILVEISSFSDLYQRAKAISPFAGKFIICADRLSNSAIYFGQEKGDLEKFVRQMTKEKGLWEGTECGNSFLITFPEPDADKIDTVCIKTS